MKQGPCQPPLLTQQPLLRLLPRLPQLQLQPLPQLQPCCSWGAVQKVLQAAQERRL